MAEQQKIGLLLSGGVNGPKIAGFYAVAVAVGHKNPHAGQRKELGGGAVCAIIAVPGYMIHGEVGEQGLKRLEILHTVAQMEHHVRPMGAHGGLHVHDNTVGV